MAPRHTARTPLLGSGPQWIDGWMRWWWIPGNQLISSEATPKIWNVNLHSNTDIYICICSWRHTPTLYRAQPKVPFRWSLSNWPQSSINGPLRPLYPPPPITMSICDDDDDDPTDRHTVLDHSLALIPCARNPAAGNNEDTWVGIGTARTLPFAAEFTVIVFAWKSSRSPIHQIVAVGHKIWLCCWCEVREWVA